MATALTKSNLAYLCEAKAGLNPDKQREVDGLLIGILSVRIPEKDWQDAVQNAVKLATQ